MRFLSALLLLVALTSAPLAQVIGPPAHTVVLAGPGATAGRGLGYHVNVRQRVFAISSDSLPSLLAYFFGSLDVSAEGYYQRGLVNDGSPWTLGAGAVPRVVFGGEDWPVRPYAIPVSVGLFVEGLMFSGDLRPAVGVGNGFGIEVPVGAVVLTVEGRSVLLYPPDAERSSTTPFSVGVRF